MKIAANIAGGFLGLLFIAFSSMFFLGMMPKDNPFAPGSPPAHFMEAFIPTGYMHFVKSLEFAGGILVAIPKTRNFGLLVLGPIIINILAFHILIERGPGLPEILPVLVLGSLALFLLWAGRKAFSGLMN